MTDRDELADRDDLAALVHSAVCRYQDCREAPAARTPGELAAADAIIAAGWIHWPHDCDTEAELIAEWAHTSAETLAELDRARTENAALRRRLVEAGALDPSESVGE